VEQTTSHLELEIMAAEREVDDARAKLGTEIEAVAESGRDVVHKIAHQARPVLMAITVVAGLAIVAGTVRLVCEAVARPRTLHFPKAAVQRSTFVEATRSALVSAMRIVVSSLVRRAIRSIEHPDVHQKAS